MAKELMQKSAYRYRIDQANELMKDGDPESAIIPTSGVLRTAKWELKKSLHLDSDPVRALQIMQGTTMKNIIHSIGLQPFFVHYATKHQHTLYRTMTAMDDTVITFDATGSIVRSIQRPDGSKSNAIFLYIVVIQNPKVGQICVAQMLSEKHNTSTINFWLNEWLEKPGLPFPKEVICDASKALLAAAVRAFTKYDSINEYSDACMETPAPPCFIRIDVAHWMKKYADFLKVLRSKIKTFYLACIGQLILSTERARAEKIIRAIFTISCSETEGLTQNGTVSPCEREKEIIGGILSSASDVDFTIEDAEIPTENEETSNDELNSNRWYQWTSGIYSSAREEIEKSDGTRINAHFFPALAERILHDCKWLPLWTCIARDQFGYGRIPASSAYVEAEFKIIKYDILKSETLPMRVDDFLAIHVQAISGTTKFKESSLQATEKKEVLIRAEPSEREPEPPHEVESLNQQICVACANNDVPSGAHKCVVCEVPVHALDFCSVPYHGDEEGYGQRRVCLSCRKQCNLPRIIESRVIENWRGLALRKNKKSSGRYLKESYPVNEFLVKDDLPKIPRFKNGNALELKAVRSNNQRIDLSNTCAFDSLFQLFLTAAFDSQIFFENVIEKNIQSAKLFELVKKVKNGGVTAATYEFRSKILCEIFTKEGKENLGCYQVQCETTVACLCKKLLQDIGSFREVNYCDKGCSPPSIILPTMTISSDALLSSNFNKEIEEEISLAENDLECSIEGCRGKQRTKLEVPGNFVIFEVMQRDLTVTEDLRIQLSSIPTRIQLSMMDVPYKLVGVIDFQAPKILTRNLDFSAIGHYVPICYRNGTWVKCGTKDKICSGKFKSCVHVVIYSVF